MSLLYCVSSMFCFHICFILLLHDPVFLTTSIRGKGNSQEKRVLVQVGAMSKDGKFRVEKFNGQNYQLWKMQMEDYLYQKDLFLPFDGITKKSITMKDEEWEILDRKALGMIRLSLEASVAFNISKEKPTKGFMGTLDKLCEKPSMSNKIFLMII
jgi:hypothetical protein